MTTLTDEQDIRDYLNALQNGERVIETTRSALWNRQGVVYRNDSGHVCVLWDGPEKMGTSVTWGTRRIKEPESC